MERISKPHLVDLLRIFDKRRWLHPRILYASVKRFFFVYMRGDVIHFKLRECVQNMLRHLPDIAYDLAQRQYLFGGSPFDVPAESRKRPVFSISHVPVTVVFPQL